MRALSTNGKGKLALWLAADALYIVATVFLLFDTRHEAGTFIVAHIVGIGLATMVMFTGIGAGVLWFPFFTFIGCSPSEGVTLSLFTQIAGKGSGSLQYFRDEMIDWRW